MSSKINLFQYTKLIPSIVLRLNSIQNSSAPRSGATEILRPPWFDGLLSFLESIRQLEN